MRKSPAQKIGSASPRQLKVGEEIRHLLAGFFDRGEVVDETGNPIAVTITEVRMPPDLKLAIVFVLPLGGTMLEAEAHNTKTLASLKKVKGFVRYNLSSKLTLKFSPDLQFRLDTSFIEAGRIQALLNKPEVARDLAS